MDIIGRIESLWRYPVKSMRGEQLSEAYVGFGGIYGDRRYAFLNSGAREDLPFLTAREKHEMLLHRALYRYPEQMVKPNGTALPNSAVEIETPAGERLAIDDPRLIDLLRAGLRERYRLTLIQSANAITDSRPVSLFFLQTTRQLSAEIGIEMDKRRFRANIYVDGAATSGFAEDSLVGRKLAIGADVVVEVLKRSKRCKMITLDPDSGVATPEIMKRVARDHESCAGIYVKAVVEGMVALGDEIRLAE